MDTTPLAFTPLAFPSGLLEVAAREASFDQDSWFCEILEIRFAGKYPTGSAGNNHAAFMRMWTAGALALNAPDVVLLDLRELEYTWGNGILQVFEVVDSWDTEIPLGIVVSSSARCDAGLASLLTPVGGVRPSALVADHAQALAHARTKAVERAKRVG